MSLWCAGLCQGVCLVGSCVLRKTLSISLSADGWGCVPTLLVVWPKVTQHWSLQAGGWGQVLVPKCQPLGELTPMNIPWGLYHQCPCPHSEPQMTLPTQETSKTHRWVWPRLLWSLCFALGSSACETLCVPSKIGVSVYPSPVELLYSSPAVLQSQKLWRPLPPVPNT